MGSTKRVLFGFYLLGGWALDARLPAATSDGLVFELESRSILIDECVPCDRAPRELPLSGRFVLSPTGVDEAPFALTELALETAGGDYHVTGSGTYTRHSMLEGQPPSQEMSLAASINGREVKLESRLVPLEARWPFLDISVAETDPPDIFNVYHLHIVAAPRAQLVPYALAEGSYLVESCQPQCERPAVQVPLSGTFLLGEISVGPLFTLYRVDNIEFHNASPGQGDWRVTGDGDYGQGGEVACMQEMNLQVQVKDTRGVLLASGPATCGRAFPEIEIDLTHKGPPGLLVYTLHLVARPQKGDFLRGDCNGDGQVTGSVTDAVLLLSYNFTGGREPPCLAACDANGDGQVLGQVADAIYLLEFGFLGGSPPSAPYPACGPGTEPDHALGCKAPPSACGGG